MTTRTHHPNYRDGCTSMPLHSAAQRPPARGAARGERDDRPRSPNYPRAAATTLSAAQEGRDGTTSEARSVPSQSLRRPHVPVYAYQVAPHEFRARRSEFHMDSTEWKLWRALRSHPNGIERNLDA